VPQSRRRPSPAPELIDETALGIEAEPARHVHGPRQNLTATGGHSGFLDAQRELPTGR